MQTGNWLPRILLISAVTSTTACSANGNATGTYVGSSPNAAFLVQLVQGDRGQLTGRYEDAVLAPDGQTRDQNASVSGAVNGRDVVVSIQPGTPLASKVVVSGTIEGGRLQLAGGGDGVDLKLALSRADEAAFNSKRAALVKRGQEIILAKSKVEAARKLGSLATEKLASVVDLTNRITRFDGLADSLLPKFTPATRRYSDITVQMQAGLAREKSIRGDGQAAVARSQIAIALNQAALSANQIHMSQNQTRQALNNDVGAIMQAQSTAKLACEAGTSGGYGDVDQQTWSTDCAKFRTASAEFQGQIAKLHTAFTDLEATWTAENATQQAIVQEGFRDS